MEQEDIMDSNIYFFYLYNKNSIINMKLKGGITKVNNNNITLEQFLQENYNNPKDNKSRINTIIEYDEKPQQVKFQTLRPQEKIEIKSQVKQPIKSRIIKVNKRNNYLDIVKIYSENYIDYIKEHIKFKKYRPNNYKLFIDYIKDYKYYNKNLDINKSPKVISYSKYKINNIKTRINDYFDLDNFFTNNINLFINKDDINKRKYFSSSLSSSIKYNLDDLKGGRKKRRRRIKGGILKQTGIDILSVLNILDSKHDFYDVIAPYCQDYLNKKYTDKLTNITAK